MSSMASKSKHKDKGNISIYGEYVTSVNAMGEWG